MTEILGWIATAVFVGSYFFKQPGALRAVQMSGAELGAETGDIISTPVRTLLLP